jgi:rhamnogalacturonan endolyase
MKNRESSGLYRFAAAASVVLMPIVFMLPAPAPALAAGDAGAPVVDKPEANTAVTITDDGNAWILGNGIVKVSVLKRSGNVSSLRYKGSEIMGNGAGRPSGIWEQTPEAAASVGGLTDSITIDPAKNGGQRGEVSVKGVTGDKVQLNGGVGGGTNCDMEIRYSLGRGDSGFYAYAIFSHPASYSGSRGFAESRFIVEMNRGFDWISVDKDRNMLECAPTDWGTGVVVHAKEQRIMSVGVYKNSVEHKYSYTGVQYKCPAYGWSSTKDHIGVWFINPSIEYLSGGASKCELDCHFGDNGNPTPIILDYWKGSHYGGSQLSVAPGESWSKVVGPIFVYVNSLGNFQTPSKEDLDTLAATAGNPTVPPAWTANATALFDDALAQAKTEKARWPYDWVNGVDYPHKNERANVSGQLVISDPLAPTPWTKFTQLTVGLAYPDSVAGYETGGSGGRNFRGVSWVNDAKHYEFWNDGDADGKFTITNVRPGKYTLHAFATGVLGEFSKANITVEAGKNIDLGDLTWTPVRFGRQIWDIGYPDRTAEKFFKGDGANYWLWGWNLRYALLYPNDLTYTIGKSDYHKDWFFEEVPHATNLSFVNPEAKDPANQRFGWVKAESLDEYPQTNTNGPWRIYGRGKATTWTIKFNMDKPGTGNAVLRLSLAGADGNGLDVGLNGKQIGSIHPSPTNAIRYNTDKGIWQEQDVKFDGTLLKPGDNDITLTVPAGDLQSGVVWDYLRLEMQ